MVASLCRESLARRVLLGRLARGAALSGLAILPCAPALAQTAATGQPAVEEGGEVSRPRARSNSGRPPDGGRAPGGTNNALPGGIINASAGGTANRLRGIYFGPGGAIDRYD